jgi:hypothetical protein
MEAKVSPAELDGLVSDFADMTRAEIYEMQKQFYVARLITVMEPLDSGVRNAGMMFIDGLPEEAPARRLVMGQLGVSTAMSGHDIGAVIWATVRSDCDAIDITGMNLDGVASRVRVGFTRDLGGNLVPRDKEVLGLAADESAPGDPEVEAFLVDYLRHWVPPVWDGRAELHELVARMPLSNLVREVDSSVSGRVTFTWMGYRMVLKADGRVKEVSGDEEFDTDLSRFSEVFIGGTR